MGTVTLVNATGNTLSISNLTINSTALFGQNPDGQYTSLDNKSELSTTYDAVDSSNFSDMELDVILRGVTFHINLNQDHWFGGDGSVHYPGAQSNIQLTLQNLVSADSSVQSIQLALAYGGLTGGLTESTDTSKLLTPLN